MRYSYIVESPVKMKKSLKVLCFILPVIVALLIIAAILINQFTGGGLLSTFQSAGNKVLNTGAQIFNKITDLINFCVSPIWNAYVNNVFNKVAPVFVTGLWYEVLIKVAGLLCFLILVTGIFKFVATQRRDDITGSSPGTIYVFGLIWLLFCVIVCVSLVAGFIVFGVGNGVIRGPNLNDTNVTALKTIDESSTDEAATDLRAAKVVNETPKFTSSPVTKAAVEELYTYDVNAKDPDAGDMLTYSLIRNPTGMTIDPASGLIQWTPTNNQRGSNDVVVKIEDDDSIPASKAQFFTITVDLPNTPATIGLSQQKNPAK